MALVIGKKQAANGIDSQWREYTDTDGSASLLIRGIDHKPFQNAVSRINRYGEKLDQQLAGGLTAEVLNAGIDGGLNEMDAHFLIAAQHLIVDWKGFQDENGDDLPYSADLANTLMTAKPQIYTWLINNARDIQQSANVQVDETVKKPLPVTTGSSKAKAQKKPD